MNTFQSWKRNSVVYIWSVKETGWFSYQINLKLTNLPLL